MLIKERVPLVRVRGGLYWSDGVMLVSGCSRVSEECRNCWALRYEKRFGVCGGGGVEFHRKRLERAVRVKVPQVYCIWNDFFHEGILPAYRRWSLDMMRGEEGSRHIYIILTKRLERMEEEWEVLFGGGGIPRNVIFGFTAGYQEVFEKRYKVAVRLWRRHGVRFMCSVEPILGRIIFPEEGVGCLQWVVTGVETGPGSRASGENLLWMVDLLCMCRVNGVPVFVKNALGSELELVREFPEIK